MLSLNITTTGMHDQWDGTASFARERFLFSFLLCKVVGDPARLSRSAGSFPCGSDGSGGWQSFSWHCKRHFIDLGGIRVSRAP